MSVVASARSVPAGGVAGGSAGGVAATVGAKVRPTRSLASATGVRSSTGQLGGSASAARLGFAVT